MEIECYHKEFFGLGLLIMGVIYLWFEMIWSILKNIKNLENKEVFDSVPY